MTSAETVQLALDQLGIDLGDADVVEPALDTPIEMVSFRINVYRARPVKIIDGNREIITRSAYWSPRLIAEQAGLKVYREDEFEISTASDYVTDDFVGEVVTIDRATPVKIVFDNQEMSVRTHQQTVAGLLEEQGIKLDKHDFTEPGVDTAVAKASSVRVVRVGHEVETVEQSIAPQTKYITDYNMPIGVTKVEREGAPGRRVISYEITRHNGKVVDREETSNVVALAVEDRVILIGSSNNGQVYCSTQGNTKNVNLTNAALGYELASARGWSGEQWSALLELWACESSWTHTVSNYAGSGAYGIPQALPAYRMATHGDDYLTNPRTQIRWGLDYIANRYGTPTAAMAFHNANNWY